MKKQISAAVLVGALGIGAAALLVPEISDAAIFSNARVITSKDATIRNAAGTGASVVGTQKANRLGTITGGPTTANSLKWWKVNFETGPDGWTTEGELSLPYFPPSESNGGWRRVTAINATPSAAQKNDIKAKTGMDWDKLKLAFNYSQSFGGGSTVIVIRNGWIAGEWGNTNSARIASITKSLTGLATAKMYDMSRAGRFDTTITKDSFVFNYLPASWDDSDSRKRNIRVRHLTTMASGIQPHDNPGQSGYSTSFVLSRPVKVAPDTEWSYSSLPVDLLSIVVQDVTGTTLRNFFNQQIASPIGVPAVSWESLGTSSFGSRGASLRPRDLGRIGYLMMMDGAWSGGTNGERQIVSRSEAINLRTHPSVLDGTTFVPTPGTPFNIRTDSQKFYGNLWWTNHTGAALGSSVPKSAYYAHGFTENLVIIVPSHNMVVVRMGSNPASVEAFKRELMTRVMDAVVTQ
jgi:CubicO group peptidase (beta-lactamase class C family)